MAPDRRNQIILGLLLVALVSVLYRSFGPQGSGPASVTTAAATDSRRPDAALTTINAPDVHLEALKQDRTGPSAGERNLFRFRTRVAATAARTPGSGGAALPPPLPPPAGPPPPPAVPAIALKFIGVVEATEKSQTYAVLRDDRGVYHGREGDIIEGRYRILRIGAESIDLAYVDGRGRQTLRLGS